ncbi:MAG: phage shock protein PspA [Acetobacteraceae bacterium]
MGIFSRLSDIVNSNLNAILARAEDPEKIIRLIVQEMEDTLVEVRSAAVRGIAERKEQERRVEALQRDVAEWERKAELALTRGREDLARGALAAKSRAAAALAEAERQLAQLAEVLTRQHEDIARLQAKLDDARTRQRALIARHQTAANRLRLRRNLFDQRITDAFARFEQVERALDEAEGKVEAFDLGRKAAPGDEFAQWEQDATVQDELDRLKARLGNRLPVVPAAAMPGKG